MVSKGTSSTHVFGELGRTPGTQEVLKQWEQEEEFFSE